MRRREFVAYLGGAFAAWPFALKAQKPAMPVVGVLAVDIQGRVASLRAGLRDAGYIEGRNLRVEVRGLDDLYAGIGAAVSDLVRLKVDVIVASGNTAVVAATKATSTIPIVMVAAVDPVKEKLADSLSRPGGNVTGLTTIGQELVPKRLELLKQTIPGMSRVGILWDPDSRGSSNSYALTQAAAKALKLELLAVEARKPGDFDRALETFARSRTNMFVLMNATMFEANRKALLEAAAAHRVGGIFPITHWAEGGGLISYGADPIEPYRRAAAYVDKILKGAKPGDLPIEQPTKFELVVNQKTAKTLGIKIPQSILVRADRVIE